MEEYSDYNKFPRAQSIASNAEKEREKNAYKK